MMEQEACERAVRSVLEEIGGYLGIKASLLKMDNVDLKNLIVLEIINRSSRLKDCERAIKEFRKQINRVAQGDLFSREGELSSGRK